jgi:uncharacterized membrane protein YedE/YeeE
MRALDLLSLGLAALIGFAVHRASLCNVRAVADLIDAGNPRMLVSFIKAVAWSATVAGTLLIVLHLTPAVPLARSPFPLALAGGFVFGAGAAFNGGCSLSTLQRLADGELSMLVTLAGLVLGAASWTAFEVRLASTTLLPAMTPWMRMSAASALSLVALWVWAAWEIVYLWRTSPRHSLRQIVLAPTYRLASAAAVLGIAGGLLYAAQGSWTYTNFLRAQVASAFGRSPPKAWQALMLLALLAGMTASAIQRRSFTVRTPTAVQATRHAAAGWLMGVGAALIPGGNDTLLLASLPTLSAQAGAVYLALLAGIAIALWAVRRAGAGTWV